jgi:hypothetical protein
MNRATTIAIYAGLSLVFCGCPKNQVQSRGAAAQKTYGAQTTYSRDAHGLEQQFEPFLEEYARGNTESEDRAFAIFAIPEASNWFAGYFAPADVEQLGWDYEAEVDLYKKSLTNVMRMVGGPKRFHAHCTPADRSASLQPRADAVKPIKELHVEQFAIEFVSEGGRKFSELANFVYADGAYRYVGKGAYPFWSMPDATRK